MTDFEEKMYAGMVDSERASKEHREKVLLEQKTNSAKLQGTQERLARKQEEHLERTERTNWVILACAIVSAVSLVAILAVAVSFV